MDYPVTFLKTSPGDILLVYCPGLFFVIQRAFSSYSTSLRISSFSQQNNTQKSYSLQFMRAFSVKIFFIKLLLAQIPLSPGDF